MALTTNTANWLLDHTYKGITFAAPSRWYAQLHYGDPGSTGESNKWQSVGRVEITDWSVSTTGSIVPTVVLEWVNVGPQDVGSQVTAIGLQDWYYPIPIEFYPSNSGDPTQVGGTYGNNIASELHDRVVGQAVKFFNPYGDSYLPSQVVPYQTYFVQAVKDDYRFRIATTPVGSAIAFDGPDTKWGRLIGFTYMYGTLAVPRTVAPGDVLTFSDFTVTVT